MLALVRSCLRSSAKPLPGCDRIPGPYQFLAPVSGCLPGYRGSAVGSSPPAVPAAVRVSRPALSGGRCLRKQFDKGRRRRRFDSLLAMTASLDRCQKVCPSPLGPSLPKAETSAASALVGLFPESRGLLLFSLPSDLVRFVHSPFRCSPSLNNGRLSGLPMRERQGRCVPPHARWPIIFFLDRLTCCKKLWMHSLSFALQRGELLLHFASDPSDISPQVFSQVRELPIHHEPPYLKLPHHGFRMPAQYGIQVAGILSILQPKVLYFCEF
jgi:hypothetical protein